MKAFAVALTSTGGSLTPDTGRGASRATGAAAGYPAARTTECNPRHQAPAGARSGDAPTRSHGGHSMRQLVLILKGKPATVVAALQALAAREERVA